MMLKRTIKLSIFFGSICLLLFSQQSKVIAITETGIMINLGSEAGVRVGMTGKIYYEVSISGEKKPIYIAKFEIIKTNKDSSEARIIQKSEEVKLGYFVRLDQDLDKLKIEAQAAKNRQREQEVVNKLEEEKRAAADDAAWQMAAGIGTAEAFGRYLKDYPSGRHAAEAKQKAGLEAEASKQAEEAERQRRVEEARRGAEPIAGQVWAEKVTGMEFVWVPGGEFDMGSNSGDNYEKPVHRVYVEGFWMGKYEVTQGQWKTIMGSNPANFKSGDNYPVDTVSWDNVQDYIRQLNSRTGERFRLPTEAEWEYACRAGTTGERYGNLDEIGWYLDNAGKETHPVGQKLPNAFGLYDILGNVIEWCQDWYGSYSSGYVRNPSGPSSGLGRVCRGGSGSAWAQRVRAAGRDGVAPSFRGGGLGFRLARTGESKVKQGQLIPFNQCDTPPTLVRRVEPEYPSMVKEMQINCQVTLNALIDETGSVIRTEILKPADNPYGFERVAQDAVMKWKYKPAIKEGVFVKVWMPIVLSFMTNK
jgi:TonB family protein